MWYSNLYRNYIVGGLIAVVVLTVLAAIFEEKLEGLGSRIPLFAGGGAATLFLLGILIYWWYQFLTEARKEMQRLEQIKIDVVPELSALASWTKLFEQMVLYAGDADILKKEREKTGRGALEWFAWANLIALFPIVNVWLYLFGVLSQERFLGVIVPVLIGLIILMPLRTYFLLGGNSKEYEAQVATGLGLKPMEGNGSKSRRLEGTRRGLKVAIDITGRNSKTLLKKTMPPFTIESEHGKLTGTGQLREETRAAISGLPKAKRWEGIRVAGSNEGITISRQSRGLNMWLYDLWLAERLVEFSIS